MEITTSITISPHYFLRQFLRLYLHCVLTDDWLSWKHETDKSKSYSFTQLKSPHVEEVEKALKYPLICEC